MQQEVFEKGHCIYPHYMGKKPEQSFRSSMIKGRFYDFVRGQIPQNYLNNRAFRREAYIDNLTLPNTDRPHIKGDGGNEQDAHGPWYAANSNVNHSGNINGHHSMNGYGNMNVPLNAVPNGYHHDHGHGGQSAVQPLGSVHVQQSAFDPFGAMNGVQGMNGNVAINQNQQNPDIKDDDDPIPIPIANPVRYENVDDDFEDQKVAENVPLEAVIVNGVDVQNGNGAQNGFVEAEDNDDDLDWIDEVTFVQLNAKIEDLRVREYLQDADTLDIGTINNIRAQLAAFMSTKAEGSKEQWEAFHLDMYYETALQRIRNRMSHLDIDLAEDSDNVNENEEEKRSSTD